MPRRYPPALVVLHWLTAFLVVGALLGGTFNMANVPNTDPGKVDTLRMHMIVGVVILVLMVARMLIRRRKPVPAPLPGPPWQVSAAQWMHLALYLITASMAISGIALAIVSGLPDMVFGTAPLPESFHIHAPRMLHGMLASVLMVLVVGHVAAALWHTVIRRDGILSRMWFGR